MKQKSGRLDEAGQHQLSLSDAVQVLDAALEINLSEDLVKTSAGPPDG